MKTSDTGGKSGGRFWRFLKGFLFFTAVVVIGLTGGLTYAVMHEVGGVQGVRHYIRMWQDPAKQVFPDGQDRMNILCLGIDYNTDEKGIQYTKHARSDTVFVISIDRKAEGLSMVSIPRDMRVNIPTHGWDKLNAAYALKANGAVDLAKQTVENFLGIKIDHTIVIKPYAAEHFVDALGGVDLDVEENMDYDDHWGNLHIHLKKGYQHLNGKQAVGYIRFRHDAEGDRGRMRRQQQLVNTMMSQLKHFKTLTHLKQVQEAFKQDIQTSLTYDQLIALGMLYKGFDRKKMKSGQIAGKDDMIDDTYVMLPDEAQKRQMVATLLHGEDTPKTPAQIRVEVLNGSLVSGAARRFADLLTKEGFTVVRVGNADAVSKNRLVDHSNDPHATESVQRLMASCGAVEVTKDDQAKSNADITVVLGRNYTAQ